MSRRPDPATDDLDELVGAFARWRATRRTRTGATPELLRHRVVSLLDTHRPATIARALAISPVAIERWAAKSSTTRASPVAPSPHFVALPVEEPETNAPENTLPELVLRWPGGATLVVRGAIPRVALAAILEAYPTFGASAPEARR